MPPEITIDHEFNWLLPLIGIATVYRVACDGPDGIQQRSRLREAIPMQKTTVRRVAGRLMKPCPRCRRLLLVERFSPDPSKDWGIRSWCRACRNPGGERRGVVVARKVRRSRGAAILRAVVNILKEGG